MWLLFIFFHLVGLVGYNLALRKSLVARADKLTLATVMQTAIAIPALLILPFISIDLGVYDASAILQILVTILLVIALQISNVKALNHLDAGTYSILYNLRIVFTTVLGILFLSEDIIPLRILGGLFIFFGVLTIGRKGRAEISSVGLQWGIAASVVISFLNMFEKSLINNVGYMAYAAPVMILAALIMWAALLLRGKRVKLNHFKEPKTLELMIFRSLSAYGFTLAFNAGAVISVATYISSLSVIVIVLLGIWLLGERTRIRQKLAATCLAVIGLTCILIANL